jgi:hypothetical protein
LRSLSVLLKEMHAGLQMSKAFSLLLWASADRAIKCTSF